MVEYILKTKRYSYLDKLNVQKSGFIFIISDCIQLFDNLFKQLISKRISLKWFQKLIHHNKGLKLHRLTGGEAGIGFQKLIHHNKGLKQRVYSGHQTPWHDFQKLIHHNKGLKPECL